MSNNKWQQEIQSLTYLLSKIHASKLKIVSKLKEAYSEKKEYFSYAIKIKEVYEYCEKHFKIKSLFYNGSKNKKLPVLWIYFSSKKNLLSMENNILEEIIDDNFNRKKDFMIAVGRESIEYCKKEKHNVIYSFKNKKTTLNKIPALILSLYRDNVVGSVKVVIHSKRITDKPISILPLKDLNNYDELKIIDKKIDYHFYPDLPNILKQLFQTYIFHIIKSIIKESDSYVIKQSLYNHTNSEKNIESKIDNIWRKIHKLRQEKSTNEVLMLSASKKYENLNNIDVEENDV